MAIFKHTYFYDQQKMGKIESLSTDLGYLPFQTATGFTSTPIIGKQCRVNEVNDFFATYQPVLTEDKEIAEYLINKLESYHQVRVSLKLKEIGAGLMTELLKFETSYSFTQWVFAGYRQHMERELREIQQRQHEFDYNYLLVAAVAAEYLNRNYAELSPLKIERLVAAIRPALNNDFPQSNMAGLPDFVTEIVGKVARSQQRILLATEKLKTGRENNNAVLIQQALTSFVAEMDFLKDSALEKGEHERLVFLEDIRVLVKNDIYDFASAEQLLALRNLKTLFPNDGAEQGDITAQNIINYLLSYYSLDAENPHAEEGFLKIFRTEVGSRPDYESKYECEKFIKRYRFATEVILPAFFEYYHPEQEDMALAAGLKADMEKNAKIMLSGDIALSKYGQNYYKAYRNYRLVLKNLAEVKENSGQPNPFWNAENEQEYRETNREYYRAAMRQLYQLSPEEYSKNNQLREFLESICSQHDEHFAMLPAEDQQCIELLLALANDKENVPALVGNEFDASAGMHAVIQQLNNYLSTNETHNIMERVQAWDQRAATRLTLAPNAKYACQDLLVAKCEKAIANPKLTPHEKAAYKKILLLYKESAAHRNQENIDANQGSSSSRQPKSEPKLSDNRYFNFTFRQIPFDGAAITLQPTANKMELPKPKLPPPKLN